MAKKDSKDPEGNKPEATDELMTERPAALGMDDQAGDDAAARPLSPRGLVENVQGPAQDRPPVGEAATDEPPAPNLRRYGNVVICPYCNLQCKSNRTEPLFTRYYCPGEGCGYSQKVMKPEALARLNRRQQQAAREEGFGARD
jgi:hypothetical protein